MVYEYMKSKTLILICLLILSFSSRNWAYIDAHINNSHINANIQIKESHHNNHYQTPHYNRGHHGYKYGYRVRVLPVGYARISVRGNPYYYRYGVYYRYGDSDYIVVEPPNETIFSFQVPTSRGVYNTVVIRKSGSGYIGPRGEFYEVFPESSQLSIMYGN